MKKGGRKMCKYANNSAVVISSEKQYRVLKKVLQSEGKEFKSKPLNDEYLDYLWSVPNVSDTKTTRRSKKK